MKLHCKPDVLSSTCLQLYVGDFIGTCTFRVSAWQTLPWLLWTVSVTVIINLLGMESDGQSSANPKCGDTYTYQFPIGQGRSFFCHPSLKGRYVIIRFVDKDKPLTLCEVEVYSERRGIVHEIYINIVTL